MVITALVVHALAVAQTALKKQPEKETLFPFF
jgi:hypothetical protein